VLVTFPLDAATMSVTATEADTGRAQAAAGSA